MFRLARPAFLRFQILLETCSSLKCLTISAVIKVNLLSLWTLQTTNLGPFLGGNFQELETEVKREMKGIFFPAANQQGVVAKSSSRHMAASSFQKVVLSLFAFKNW